MIFIEKSIKSLFIFFCVALVIIISYLVYIQVYLGESLANDSRNRRVAQKESNFIRGRILDRNGEILAETNDEKERIYPRGDLFAHVIGYVDSIYGKSGLEAHFDGELLGLKGTKFHTRLLDRFFKRPTIGNDLVLTLDARLQQVAYDALGDNKGAVVAINPKSGEILACVSKPGFDPNILQDEWSRLLKSDDAPFLNRATQGLYPPGSSIKPVVAAAALENKVITDSDRFLCDGREIINGYEITCVEKEKHGEINLIQAMALSCNITFASIGASIGETRFYEYIKGFMLLDTFELPIPVKAGRLPPGGAERADLIENSIGQGKVLATPLHMALIASTFANNGVMMKPRLVSSVRSREGRRITSYPSEVLNAPVAPDVARKISEMMIEVVRYGTGKRAQIDGIIVAGKTGTAENPGGGDHAWFIGFAPAGNPEIAVAVVVENGGYGGVLAAPIGRKVIIKALSL